MIEASSRVIDVSKKRIDDYVFEIIVSFQEGVDNVVVKGYGEYISKAVDVYNELCSRLGESIELVNVEIGSEKKSGRLRSFIAITIRKKY